LASSAPAHLRHDQIGKQKLNTATLRMRRKNGSSRSGGGENGLAQAGLQGAGGL